MIQLIPYLLSLFSFVLTFTLGRLSKKYGWNEDIPIQSQNILVGIFTLGTTLIISHLIGENLGFVEVANEIIGTISGVGGATLLYDNIKPMLKKYKED